MYWAAWRFVRFDESEDCMFDYAKQWVETTVEKVFWPSWACLPRVQ